MHWEPINYSPIPLNTIKTTPKPAQPRAQSVPKSFERVKWDWGGVGHALGTKCIIL